MKKKTIKHYCDKCRNITEHYGVTILGDRAILCINWLAHWHIVFCRKCGLRIDNGQCQEKGADWHTPEPC